MSIVRTSAGYRQAGFPRYKTSDDGFRAIPMKGTGFQTRKFAKTY